VNKREGFATVQVRDLKWRVTCGNAFSQLPSISLVFSCLAHFSRTRVNVAPALGTAEGMQPFPPAARLRRLPVEKSSTDRAVAAVPELLDE